MDAPHTTASGRSALSADEIRRFHEEGYLRWDGLIRGAKLARYKSALDRLVERGNALEKNSGHFSLERDENNAEIPHMLHKVQGVCVVEPAMRDLAREPEILDRIAALIGDGEIDIFGTKFFPMLPGGTSTRWHQDNYYFGTKGDGARANDGEMVTCGIYFEDTDRSNGCLRIVPRSHLRTEIVDHRNFPGGYGHWADVDESRAVDVICPGGTAILFSPYLLHGAFRNESNRTRYSTAWHYIRGDLDLVNFPRGKYDDRHTVRSIA